MPLLAAAGRFHTAATTHAPGAAMQRTSNVLFRAMLVLGVALVAGCGGGGGGNTVRESPPPAAPPPTPPVVEPANPAYSAHMVSANVAPAHAAGLTGAGIRIGVVDSGVNRNHPALYPRVVSNLVYISPSGNNLSVDDVVGHGTAVSQTMAGTPFGAWPGGIAPGAQIISARIISDKPPTDDGSGQGNEVSGALGLKPVHQALIDRGARIMNNSWGGLYWTNLDATAPIADEYRPFIATNGGLVVFAAGNEGRASPTDMAALPSKPGPNGTTPAADLERGWLTVVALDGTNPTQLASYSNACGIAMHYCLAALGEVVVTGTNDGPTSPTYWRYRGTSLAAPQVSGAAALVWQAFPYFNNDLVRQTLLGTANDIGAPGVDPVFGYGSLNVGRAVRGPARFDWGDVTVNLASGTSTWSNDIEGDGGLVKLGAGTLKLEGAAAYNGTTRVAGGTLDVARHMNGSAVVSAGGTLRMSGTNGDLRNDGVLDVRAGGSTSVRTVGGNFVQSSTGQLVYLVGGPIHVHGTATLAGQLQVAGIANGYVRNETNRESVLFAFGGLSGTFDSLTAGSGVFLDATLGYGANEAWLDITRLDVSATASAMGFTPMSLNAAERVEQAFRRIDGAGADGASVPVDSGFVAAAGAFQRTPDATLAERSLSSLSGELHAADRAFAKLAIDANRHALHSHLAGPARAGGAWAADVGGELGLSHFEMQRRGWVLGQDQRLGERFVVGAAIAESASLAQGSLRDDRERNRQVEGQFYAQWSDGRSQLLGRLATGRMERTLQRELFLGAERFGVGSDYASRYTSASLEAGHRFGIGAGAVTPYAGLQSTQLDRGGFGELGAFGFGLGSGDSRWRETLALAGVRLAHGWNAGAVRLSLDAHAEWQRVLSHAGDDIDARFMGIDVWSPIDGGAFGGDAGTLGVGLQSRWSSGASLGLSLDARRGAGDAWQRVMLRWVRPF